MSSILKFKTIGTTFVNSGNANENYNGNKNLFAGSIHKTSCSSVMFKSLIKFDLDSLQSYPLSYAYLCLYVKDINTDTSYYSNNIFSLYKNTTSFDPSTVTWNTIPETDGPLSFTVNQMDRGHYIKINISSIVNSWIQNNNNYGITLEANNFYSSLIKFSSINSANPPWLLVEYKSNNCAYRENSPRNHSFN